MDDEWCRCPICFENYSSTHRPTTFVCGHSTCIDHTTGARRLENCPICRQPLRQGDIYHVSYNLEEASRLFQANQHQINCSTVNSLPASTDDQAHRRTMRMIDSDEIYARQLQAGFNREITNQLPQREQVPIEGHINPIRGLARELIRVPVAVQPIGHNKQCGHRCELDSTKRCCTCSDRRPHLQGNLYPSYIDGRGVENNVPRNEYYCPTCKSQ